MTIRLTPKLLKTLISSTFTKPATEILSAASCTLITQKKDKLSVQCYEPGRSYHCRYLHNSDDSNGVEGSEYLVDTAELMAKVGKASANTLTLETVMGVLTMKSNLTRHNNVEKKSAIVSLRQYGGPITDFPDFHEFFINARSICKISAKAFHEWLIVKEFGEFSEVSEGDSLGRTVSVSIKDNTLVGLTNFKGAYMSYLQATAKTSTVVPEKIELSVEGLQIKKLASIIHSLEDDEPEIEILTFTDTENSWVIFLGKGGYSVLRTGETEGRYVQDRLLFESTPKITTSCTRSVNVPELLSSLKTIKPSSMDSQELLMLEDEVLKIYQAESLSEHDWASVEVIAAKSTGDWTSILINSPAILKTATTIHAYLKAASISNTVLQIDQKYIQKSKHKTWLTYLSPEEISPLLDVKFCVVSKEAEEYLELVDSDE